MNPNRTEPTRTYYGWFIVAAVFAVLMVTVGSRNSVGVFVLPMSNEFGWSRSVISFAGALGVLVNGLSQPFFGSAYDRFGGRKLILLGVLIIGITLGLLSLTFNFAYFVLVLGVIMALAMSAGSITTGAVLVSKWFEKKRATAISMSSAGVSVGGLILVPFTTYLVVILGWRLTWVALGSIILFLVLPMAYFLLRDDPSDLGLFPDGEKKPEKRIHQPNSLFSVGPLVVNDWREAFRSFPMWQLCISYFVCGFTTLIMSIHFVPYAVERGFSPQTAATAFGVLSMMNAIGVLIIGPLADKFGNKNILGFLYGFRGIGYVCLLLLPGQSGLWAFAFITGASWVATVPPTTALTADVYGLKKVGTLSGIAFMAHQIGGSIGIQFGGIARDITGSYTSPFFIAVLLLIVASITSFSIQEKRYSSRYQPRRLTPSVVKG